MKRLIALVMSVLLLAMPLTGLAEAEWPESVRVTFSMAVDEDGISNVMQLMLDAEAPDEMDEQLWDAVQKGIRAACQLYKAMQVSVQAQADGLRVALLMQEVEVLNVEITWTEDEVSLASLLLPGYRLTYDIRALRGAAAQVDWVALMDDMADAVDTWLAAQHAATESGSFAGNAYEGGTARTTYTLDDRDLATLLEGLLLRLEARQDVVNLLNALADEDGGAADIFHEIRTMNHQVALSSPYRYTLAVVRNGDSAEVGYSLNVLEGDTLLGSLSLGMGTDAVLGVVSVPLWDTVAYVDFRLTESSFSYSARQAAAGTTYDAALKDDGTLRASYLHEMATEPTDNGWKGTGAYTTVTKWGDETIQLEAAAESELTFSPLHYEMTMVQTFQGEEIGRVRYVGEACEPFALAEELTPLNIASMSIEDEAALEESLESGMKTMALLMFKQLPADMIRTFMDMLMPLLMEME